MLAFTNPVIVVLPAARVEVALTNPVMVVLPAASVVVALTKPVIVELPNATAPLTDSLCPGVVLPMPTLPEYWATLTSPLANTSIDGMPDTSLTANMELERSFVMENSWPAEPSNDRVPLVVG